MRRREGQRLMRTFLIVAMAAILVAVIALLAGFLAHGPTEQSSPATSVTGPTVAPTPGVVQPSEEEWTTLLPRLEAAVAAAPDDANALRKLALAYYNLRRFDEAVAIYKRLLAGEEDAVLRDRLGNTLRDMGDRTGAEAAYRKAIADDPTLAPQYLDLAELLWRQGRDKEALAVIDEGLKAVPEESRAGLEQGRRVLEQAGG
jgi:tetratricopeptide (TPR) repeat protein